MGYQRRVLFFFFFFFFFFNGQNTEYSLHLAHSVVIQLDNNIRPLQPRTGSLEIEAPPREWSTDAKKTHETSTRTACEKHRLAKNRESGTLATAAQIKCQQKLSLHLAHSTVVQLDNIWMCGLTSSPPAERLAVRLAR